ncbi:MAG: right-handed parallel beta-helix repeat-containing protein [Planctomycetes bacterium]|nr:right-handed parallel beta-helix repeat-containing protein [Planctomycetota bacterium]
MTRFVNRETGQDINIPGVWDGTTGATPWRSITYALNQVTLTPTENMILNVAGRLDDASGAELPYDDAPNGETFPIDLPARWMITYDTANSEFFPGGTRVPVRIRSNSSPGATIRIWAIGGAVVNNQTGLDGVLAGQRLMRVERGEPAVLVASSNSGSLSESSLREVMVSDSASYCLCLEAREGGRNAATLSGVTATTSLPLTNTLLKIDSVSNSVPGAVSEMAPILQSVVLTVASSGGVATARALHGLGVIAIGNPGTANLNFTASDFSVLGLTNSNPANPLGIDIGALFVDGAGDSLIRATLESSTISACGLVGVRSASTFSGGAVGVTVRNCRVIDCGARANPSNLFEGHGVSFEAAFGGQITGRVENCLLFGNSLDGAFTWLHDPAAGSSGTLTVQMNEIGPNGRNGVKILVEDGAVLAPGSTIFSNRIHHNLVGIHNVADGSGSTSSPTIVNNVIYRNTVNGILNEALLAGSVAGPTMTHNTVAETGGVGVLVQGAGTTSSASFHNGISYHLGSPGPADLSGFAVNRINYSSFQTCGGSCTGQGNVLFPNIPQFVNYPQDDYHLFNIPASNPVVDQAINNPPAVPLFDFEGNLRQIDINMDGPAGQYADMGADEATTP